MEDEDAGKLSDMPVTVLRRAAWIKSSYSNPSGDCVELAVLTGGKIAVRNSRYPGGLTLFYTRVVMAAFLQVVKEGGFDEMTEWSQLSEPVRKKAVNTVPSTGDPL
jgi:hypothetical protein